MNLQQLRYLCGIVDHGLNVSDAAEALHTSQPGISKQVRQLEDELGVRVFVRQGKRLASLTPAGEAVVATARRALRELANLKRVGAEFRSEDQGTLSRSRRRTSRRATCSRRCCATSRPNIRRSSWSCTRATPRRSPSTRRSGVADVGIATEALATYPDLVTLPCYQWNRCVLVPRGHPLAKVQPLTLAALARHPIVTYDFSFTGRSQINAAFDAAGLVPNVVLTALDSDVIKTYVEMGTRRRHHREDGVGRGARRRHLRAARRGPPVRAVDDPARAASRRVPARLRLRFHRALRAGARPRRRRRCARGNRVRREVNDLRAPAPPEAAGARER